MKTERRSRQRKEDEETEKITNVIREEEEIE